jgi:ketosteroid isomerase-like protein
MRRFTLRFLTLAIVLALITSASLAAGGPPQSSLDAATDELERLEKVWNEAHERGDADALQALWADDLEINVPRMPVMTKTDGLSFARSGRMKFSRYATSDIRVRVYGDTAVVSGRLQRTRTINGKELSDDWRFTKVYVRRSQQWRVVSFHASEAA